MRALHTTALALATGCVVAGCEVGAYFQIGPEDDAPSVSLAASPPTASPGEIIGLIAAASDDYRVVEVVFYRLDSGGASTLLGRDASAPYALETRVPTAATGQVRYLAEAIDDAGQVGQSETVVVTVR